jgi:hypothetical protein
MRKTSGAREYSQAKEDVTMTGEEMERAIEFLLQSQTNLENQVAETNRIMQLHADTQSQFIQIVTSSIERLAAAQARSDERIVAVNAHAAETDARLDRLVTLNAQTDERLNRLAALVERNITGGNGNS